LVRKKTFLATRSKKKSSAPSAPLRKKVHFCRLHQNAKSREQEPKTDLKRKGCRNVGISRSPTEEEEEMPTF